MPDTLNPLLSEGEMVTIPFGSKTLEGRLEIHPEESGLVILADALGIPSQSDQHRFMSRYLHRAGLSTLSPNLLDHDEIQEDRQTQLLRVDIPLLAERLLEITRWVQGHPVLRAMPLGLMAFNTGTAAAILVENTLNRPGAADPVIKTLVSRGGRPDLVSRRNLIHIDIPVLFMVGSRDYATQSVNQDAYGELECPAKLEIIPNASHHFEEPGALEISSRIATRWLQTHLLGPESPTVPAVEVSVKPFPFDTDPFRLGRTLFRSTPGF